MLSLCPHQLLNMVQQYIDIKATPTISQNHTKKGHHVGQIWEYGAAKALIKCSHEGETSPCTQCEQKPNQSRICMICGEHFQTKEKLRSHKRVHKEPWCCKKCGKTVAGATSLKNHKLRCSKDVPQYLCQICNYTCVAKYDLKRHLNIHTVSPTNLYSCDVCDFKAEAKTLLSKHVRKHTSCSKYECQKCNRKFVNKDMFEQHVADHEAQKHKQQNISEYKCNMCNYTTKRKFDLKRHGWRHNTPKIKIPVDSGPEIVSFV